MRRKYGKIKYWCAEFTDKETGLVTEVGFADSLAGITVYVQKNLDRLPKGEGKFVQKSLRKG